ncbi:hypothetical protein F5146DRAFT_157696 [Armillaria mellea]|nr:hypothetical protein F5146DRAFT_157696 [Armillaria mellea]
MFRDNGLAATLHLNSHNLEGLLADLSDGYRWRYFELLQRDRKQSNKLEELRRQRKQLETHDWLMTLLPNGLKDEAWKAVRDPSRKEQKVAAMVQRDGRKRRKSDCSEYERTYASKRLRGGEHGGIEVHNNKDHDEEDGGDVMMATDEQVMEVASALAVPRRRDSVQFLSTRRNLRLHPNSVLLNPLVASVLFIKLILPPVQLCMYQRIHLVPKSFTTSSSVAK